MPEFLWETALEGVTIVQESDLAGRIILSETRPPTGGLYSARTPKGHIHLPKPSGTQ